MADHVPFKVLVAIDSDVLDLKGDYSITSNAVCRRAILAANREAGSELHLITVVGSSLAPLKENEATIAHAGDDLLKLAQDEVAAFTKLSPVQITKVVAHVLCGSPGDEIVWLAARLRADLVVVGSHGRRGLSRLLLGSVAEHVLRRAGCPVLLERSKVHEETWVTPEIEPPCAQCVEARATSRGRQSWCARHLEHHARAHTYSDGGSTALAPMEPWGFSG